jgi:hypothetical protein
MRAMRDRLRRIPLFLIAASVALFAVVYLAQAGSTAGSDDRPNVAEPPRAARPAAPAELDPDAALVVPAGSVSERAARPDATAPSERIRAFLAAHPDDARAPKLRELYDRRLWPCEGLRRGAAECAPSSLLFARTRLDRAGEYLQNCLACADRALVRALRAQLEAIVLRLQTEQIEREFEAAIHRGEFVTAARLLSDADARIEPKWAQRAGRRLARLQPGTAAAIGHCKTAESTSVLFSPESPQPGERLRMLFSSEERHPDASISLEAAQGGPAAPPTVNELGRGGGPPWYWVAEADGLKAGDYRALLRAKGGTVACRPFTVMTRRRAIDSGRGIWATRREWNRPTERLYSAWIEQLFSAPEGARWRGFHQVTRDPRKNLLHGHLRLGEDDAKSALAMDPDCADAPYTFRAYFAWKLGLPFGRHECRFGRRTGPPECGFFRSNEDASDSAPEPAANMATASDGAGPPRDRRPPLYRFAEWVSGLKDTIHARSLRTDLRDDETDLYPLALTRSALRPGAVFSDPYGHTLTVVRWVEQTPSQAGAMLAVDAQPDGSLRIKRFWRGTFVFPEAHPIGGHGFKAFRPVVTSADGLRPLTNDEIALAHGYGDVSLEQARFGGAEFYARVSQLINPRPLPPEREYRALHEALLAQLELRATEVQAAEEILTASPGRVIDMPRGREIFHTTGAWESLSTPCRDMRLLVGMDALIAFPAQAARGQAGAHAQTLERELSTLHRRWSRELAMRYVRSDGTEQRLTLLELLERRAAFEMAYNPNDCPELRWGAAEGSVEAASCERRAPAAQVQQMRAMRHWFVRRYACG